MIYAQFLVIGLGASFNPENFVYKFLSGDKVEATTKSVVSFYGVAMIGLACMMFAVVRLGDPAVIRKVLQYSMVGFAINAALAMYDNYSDLMTEQLALATALLSLCNIALAVYACYGIAKPATPAKAEAGGLQWYTRYLYATLFGLGLFCSVPQLQEGTMDAIGVITEKPAPLDESGKCALSWLGAALLSASLLLIAVAQCGNAACRKVTKYGVVAWLLTIFLTAYDFSNLHDTAAYTTLIGASVNTVFTIVIVSGVTDMF